MRDNLIQTIIVLFVAVGVLAGCATVDVTSQRKTTEERTQEEIARAQGCVFFEKGMASWYGHELAGHHTANGEMFAPDGISAAHKKLPFGTIVKVVMDNGKGNRDGIMVRINDRGPFVRGRIIDLSWGAAKRLGMMDTKPVHIYRCS